jgi:hypothetical protein
MQQSVTFLFSDCDADPRILMALGGTVVQMDRRETQVGLESSQICPDGQGKDDEVFGEA